MLNSTLVGKRAQSFSFHTLLFYHSLCNLCKYTWFSFYPRHVSQAPDNTNQISASLQVGLSLAVKSFNRDKGGTCVPVAKTQGTRLCCEGQTNCRHFRLDFHRNVCLVNCRCARPRFVKDALVFSPTLTPSTGN